MPSGFRNAILAADNVDFSGSTITTPKVTADGELLIGSAVAPNIRVGNLTSIGGTVVITPGAGTINLESAAAIPTQFNEDAGIAIPAAGILRINGGANVSTSGAVNVVTVRVSGTTDHAVQVGNATGSLTSLAAMTNGQLIIGSTGTDPVVGSLSAGTGISITPSAGTISIASTGAAVTINGNSGSATGATITITTGSSNANGTPAFSASGSTVNLNVTDGYGNIGFGANSYHDVGANINNLNNVGLGTNTGHFFSSGCTRNVLIGNNAAGTTASFYSDNIAIGDHALDANARHTMAQNIVIGTNAGNGLDHGATNNILLGYNITGSGIGSNNTIIGTAGTAKCTITGISGVTPATAGAKVTITDSNGQMGTLAAMTNGQLVIGSTGANPALGQLQPGPGIAISSGAGTITVSAWGGGVSWTEETVNLNFTVNKGIIANKAGLLTVTLPATAAIGDILEITGINTAVGWRIAQNANQQIHVGAASTAAGVGGYVESTAIRDSIKLVCVVAGASTQYNALSVIGNLTVV